MPDRVIAVVVTYNRVELLPRCLEALLAQSAPLTEIIVVDNASSDATQAVLATRFAGRVTVQRMHHNGGGAGGFHTGMALALEHGADWIWLMDDDGYPDPDSLADLLCRRDALDMMNPMVRVPDAPDELSFGLRLDGRLVKRVAEVRAARSEGGIIPNEMNPFNGTLVRAALVRQHGNIKPEMFIWGDEVEFVLRCIQAGARVGTVTTATFNHPANRRQTIDLGAFGTVTVCPPHFSHFFYRNSGYYTLRYRGVIQALGKCVVYSGFLLARGQFREFGKFWAYYLDGLTDAFRLPPSRVELLAKLQLRAAR